MADHDVAEEDIEEVLELWEEFREKGGDTDELFDRFGTIIQTSPTGPSPPNEPRNSRKSWKSVWRRWRNRRQARPSY